MMLKFLLNHTYILLTIFFGVSSQLIIKWQMSQYSFEDYSSMYEKFLFAFGMLFNPYIILSLLLTLFSGLSWMIAMTKFDISYAYPYTTLGFVFILIFSSIFFNETVSINKIIGIVLIVAGIIISSKN
jgi:uncharacterized membrane protein